MNDQSSKKKLLWALLIVVAAVGSFVVKQLTTTNSSDSSTPTAASQATGIPTALLFFNSKDQDSGCQALYGLFDVEAAGLPEGAKAVKLDVNNEAEEAQFDKFSVRVLPTILFVDAQGMATERISGEGAEVEAKVKASFARARELLKL